jgi:hypothetical protein
MEGCSKCNEIGGINDVEQAIADISGMLMNAIGLLVDAEVRDDKDRYIAGALALVERCRSLASESETYMVSRKFAEVQS